MDNSLTLLGIIKKAGLIAAGAETVCAAARSGKAKAILSASDASESSQGRAKRYAQAHNSVHITLPYTKAELGAVVGRGLPGMLAVLDAGLAESFVRKLSDSNPAEYEQAAQRLLKRKARAVRRMEDTAGFKKKNAGAGKRRTAQ